MFAPIATGTNCQSIILFLDYTVNQHLHSNGSVPHFSQVIFVYLQKKKHEETMAEESLIFEETLLHQTGPQEPMVKSPYIQWRSA